ncbi:STAS domain-containing protein [Streptomyces naphthomycinicus]|uniref:STAS domain-containing protein n=1 Tax=Streptomyces naphthomycinicus TaxID=2872625 RepID=UPI001CED296F|nr:STAS domain-containing protein [Streptomyces sp. TML10]
MSWNEDVTPRLVGDADGEPLPGQADGGAPDGGAVTQYGCRGAWVVVARGSYDMQSIKPLADAMDAAARNHPKVVLDASGVVFADSTLLNLLIRAHRAGTLRIVAPPPQLRRLCALTGVDTLLETRASVEAAAAS